MFFDRARKFPPRAGHSFMNRKSFRKTTKIFHKPPTSFYLNKVRNFKLTESFYKSPKYFCRYTESFYSNTETRWTRKECFLIGKYSSRILSKRTPNGSETFIPGIESFPPKQERILLKQKQLFIVR